MCRAVLLDISEHLLFAKGSATSASTSVHKNSATSDVTTCSSPSTSMSQSHEVISSPTGSELLQNDSRVNSFDIPWSKCSPSLLQAVDNKLIPSAVDIRELVNHTVSDMFVHTRHASRALLRSIAQKIVQRQPLSFADYINGKKVGNGVESIMLMLESKKENLNRRMSGCEPASKRQNTSNENRSKVIRRTSALPDAEALARQEAIRAQLHSLYHTGSSVSSQVESGMLSTYTYQRYHANTETTVIDILDKWPFLRLTKFVLMNCKCYTGVDVEPTLRCGVIEQCELIHDFMESTRSPVTAPVLRAMNAGNKVHWPSYCLPLMMAYFREDINSVLQFFPVCAKNVGLVMSQMLGFAKTSLL